MPWLFERLGLGPSLRRWQRALRNRDALPAATIREMQREIRTTRARLDALAAEAQTALLHRAGPARPQAPVGPFDWVGRPAPWSEAMRPRGIVGLASPTPLPGGVTLYHDAMEGEMSLRQEPAGEQAGDARFALVLDVYGFDGSFVSLVHELPDEALTGLTLDHFLAADIRADLGRPIEVYLRLNVQHGPNLEQMVRQVELRDGAGRAEFDLAYTRINERRIEKAWLDLILERPEMTRVAIRDLVVMRAPRADV